jgi:hypothetical protein
MVIRRKPRQIESPTDYKPKTWKPVGREVKRYSPKASSETKCLNELIHDGETYSRSSGVELKFDEEDLQHFDWDKSFKWSDPQEIVRRYVYCSGDRCHFLL